MICIECGGTAYNNAEICENCMESNGSGTLSMDMARQSSMSMSSCAACQRMITADSSQCSNCRKNFHNSCEPYDGSLHSFTCSQCRRRNPLLSDDVMLSASAAPRGVNSDAPLSPFSESHQIALQMPSSSYPTNADFGNDMYSQMASSNVPQLHPQMIVTQSQLMDEISDGGATNDSDRNSSPFYQEASDYDEDFVPVSTRGRGRGSGKKKPGRGQSTGSRRSTNAPPPGFYSATTTSSFHLSMSSSMSLSTQPSTRGKRGKRGSAPSRSSGKGPGRGRGRGRGSAAQAAAMLQQVQYGSLPQYPFQMASSGPSLLAAQPPCVLPPSVPLPSASIAPSSTPTIPDSIVPNFQQSAQVVAIREVDESMIDDENSRQSGGSRSDEPEYIRTAVVCRINDEFLQKACMCLVCGAIGKGAEGSMVACSNCAQTYHTYCVNLHDKLNSAVLQRGWRCLDCTVCEGCGTGGDESKLLLCDECDVSYHIYCMKPPLDKIPQGQWRCQWCSRCRRCNHKAASGNDLTSQGLCHPCASLRKCPQCEQGYQLNDKIIRCSQCRKWQHGTCEGLFTEEQLEQAATNRMRCSTCRPNRAQNIGFLDADNVVVCDNVALNKNADEILKSKYTPSALKHHMMEAQGYRESFDHYDEDYNAEEASDAMAPPPTGVGRGRGRGNPGGRRGTNRIGVGGFYAKLPRHRIIALQEEASAAALGDDDDQKKTKRPRKPRRSQLEDAYPPTIQEAFFGAKAVEGKTLMDMPVEEPLLGEYNEHWKRPVLGIRGHELARGASEMLRNDINENAFLDNMDLGDIDANINLDEIDFSMFDEDDFTDELEDSLQGDMHMKSEAMEGDQKFGPTSFNLEQKPSTSQMDGLPPANMAQQAPGIRAAATLSRSGSQSTDAPERYAFSERWEEDEPLGLQATTAAVLYANEKHANLKVEHPEWSDRVKHIQKLWRILGSEERQEYVNRARDNRTSRGRIPRQRRQNVQSTNSVDSPTVQSPAPHQMGFKVPVNPVDTVAPSLPGPSNEPGIVQQQKQVRITYHLTPDALMQYQDMKRVHNDRSNLVISWEQELNKLRKQKKNLAAKKRQLQKTAQAAEGYDGREVDLNEPDRQNLANLTDRIKQVQTDAESAKREMKKEEAAVREFEVRNGILRNEADVTPQMIQQSEIRNHQMAQAEQLRAQQAIQMGTGLGGQGPQALGHNMPLAQQQHLQQQRMMQMGMMRQAPPGIPPGANPMIRMVAPPGGGPMITQQEMHRRIMAHQRRINRWPKMGGVRYDEITDPCFREVYEFLDEVLHDITVHMDNPELAAQQQRHQQQMIAQQMAAQQSHAQGQAQQQQMLKRNIPGVPPGAQGPPGLHLVMPMNLQPGQMPPGAPLPPQQLQQAPGGIPNPQMAPQPIQQPQFGDDGPKPKKKRTVQKKPTTSFAGSTAEYDGWVDKIRCCFRLCPELPKKQKEPRLNRAGCEFVRHGMADMAVGMERKPLKGDGFGWMKVNRGTRLFGNEERTRNTLVFDQVSLYHHADPPIRLVALYNNSKPSTSNQDDLIQDEMDLRPELQILNPNARIQNLLDRKRGGIAHIRSLGRYIDEPKAPLEPELKMFYEEPEEKEEDVTIELIFNTSDLKPECTVDEKAEIMVKFTEQIDDLLKIKQEDPWRQENTPPNSPAPSSPAPSTAGGPVSEVRPTNSTSRPPSTSVEKEIKREIDEEPAQPVFREIKREIVEASSSTQCRCKHCQKAIENVAPAVRLKMDKLGILNPEATTEEREELAFFCTRKCYYELMATSRVSLSVEELTAAEAHVDEDTFNRLKLIHSDNIVKAVSQGKSKLPCAPSVSASSLLANGDVLTSPRDTRYMMDEGKKEFVSVVPVCSLIGAVEAPKEAPSQRQTEDWKPYDHSVYESFVNVYNQHQQYVLSPKIGVPHPPYQLDKRLCVFCGGVGDGETSKCGRLISLTEFYWVHVNCALWSAEVYETQTGGLIHVDRAVLRAAQTMCDHCRQPGASVKCHRMNCGSNYHVLCAMQNNGHFIKDRTFMCKLHDRIAPEVCVSRLDALRRIYVKRDENALLMRLFDLSEGDRLCLRLGAFTFYKLGSILPKQLKRFHNKEYIFPNQYRVTRLFWSPKNHRERMMFECFIEDRNEQPSFVVRSLEDPQISFRASSATKAWYPIYERINHLREQQGESLKFFGSQISGETLFGLNENAIVKMTESLPGFDTLFTYNKRNDNIPVLELPLAVNPMGCARAEPRQRNVGNHFRTRPQPMGGTSHHQHGIIGSTTGQSSQAAVVSSNDPARQPAPAVNTGRTRGIRNYYTEEAARTARSFGICAELASYAHRMEPGPNAQLEYSQYQKMRREWKDRVYLARSRIAGLGLYAKNDIPMGEFIIEYKGEIIRSEVCEVREVRYVAQNRGIYMFRIDEDWVIDATMAGGPARYVNHSCDPNCSTRIMDDRSGAREKKIIITANRPISSGEELTYDYQFELEDSTDKIPCLCGAPNCVKWMN